MVKITYEQLSREVMIQSDPVKVIITMNKYIEQEKIEKAEILQALNDLVKNAKILRAASLAPDSLLACSYRTALETLKKYNPHAKEETV